MSFSLAIAIGYGLHSHGLFAATVSYAAGVERQIWQQLPIMGRGVDFGNERPITTDQTFFDPPLSGSIADVWPCSTLGDGYPNLCYSSGTIGIGTGVSPDAVQLYGGRFAPCVDNQCYPSGRIGVGSPVTWAFGPCTMQSGANGTDCYPSGTVGSGPRVPPATGQFAGPVGIAVDNTPNVGTIYITDKWNHRVQAFLFDGTLVSFAHPIGNGDAAFGPYTQVIGDRTVTGEQLSNPESIKVDAARHLLVGDAGNGRVAVFDLDGNLVDSLVVTDPSTGGRAAPTGIALTPGASFRGRHLPAGTVNPPNSRLVVTDEYNCTVFVFDATSLNQIGVAGGKGCADTGGTLAFTDLASEIGATIDNAGHIYTVDYDRNRIEIFDGNANLIGTFGDPLNGATGPAALSGPFDVMVDHRGVYTETDALGQHRVARVWVVDQANQRLVVFKVNFDAATPAATFLFELNAAGDLNGFPSSIAEDTSHDPVGKIVTTDTGNARIQRFQVPDLAVVNVRPDPVTRTVFFDVVVPVGKDPVGVTSVTPIVCPTSDLTTVPSGIAAPQPACAAARSLTPTALITPGQSVSYSFQYSSGQATATFDIFATGNPVNGIPQTTSNHASVSVTSVCVTCTITPQVVVPPSGSLEALTPPVAPSILYVGARTYTVQVSLRVTAVSQASTGGLSQILYRFISGPETATNAQPGLHSVTVSGTRASFDVPFKLEGTSVVEFWAKNVDGTEIAHKQAQLTLHLVPPTLNFRFDQATSANATRPNAAGWWNSAVSLPLDFTGQITAVTSLATGMPAKPPLTSPLSFTTEGRNLGFKVTVTDTFGLTTTKSSNDPITDGLPVNIDFTAPSIVKNAAITLERASFAGAPPPAGTSLTALAIDPALPNGAGSGVISVAPPVTVTNFPFGTSTQSLIATDAAGNTRSGNVTVNVTDTIAPVLSGPSTLTVNPGAFGNIFTMPGFSVSDASMINAPAGVTPVVVTQSVPATQILAAGSVTPVTLTARDPSGNTATLVVAVTVTFSTASIPVCSLAGANPSTLWPPNHQLATIGLRGITNADGSPVTTKVTSIFQDEPTNGLGDGDTPIDGSIVNGAAQVRAERSGEGNGRVYYINFTATAVSGSLCTGMVTVSVPYDQSHDAIGEGPKFDSTEAGFDSKKPKFDSKR